MSDTDDDTPVYVEPPHFLAPAARPGDPTGPDRSRLGYTTKAYLAMPDEPECVGPAILESYAQVNARLYTQQTILEVAAAQERRPELTPQNRHDDLRRRAKHAHVDLSHELHIIQRAIDKARMKEQTVSPRALERLERLEALLDGVSIMRMAA